MHAAKLIQSPLFFIKNEWQLQALWREHIQQLPFLITECGQQVIVIKAGEHNLRHSGADFQNAFLRIDNTFHYGNVEMHYDPSEWYAHQHHLDNSYNTVICHFSVKATKKPLYRADGSLIPNIALSQQLLPSKFLSHLMPSNSKQAALQPLFPCQTLGGVSTLPPEVVTQQLLSQLQTRLLQKAEAILSFLAKHKYNWQEVFYAKLLQSFLLPYNQAGAEILAEALPLAKLLKIPITLWEAALLYKAGLIPDPKEHPTPPDDYHIWLWKQADNYKGILGAPLASNLWNWGGNRPTSSVSTKIAAFAAMLEANGNPYQWLEHIAVAECLDILSVDMHPYYTQRLQIGGTEVKKPLSAQLSTSSKELIIINGIIPLQLAIAIEKGKKEWGLQESLGKLSTLSSEHNHTIKNLISLGFPKPSNALESQSLIAQYKQLCFEKRCHECVGGAAQQLKNIMQNA